MQQTTQTDSHTAPVSTGDAIVLPISPARIAVLGGAPMTASIKAIVQVHLTSGAFVTTFITALTAPPVCICS